MSSEEEELINEEELIDDTGYVFVDPESRVAYSDPEIEGSDDDDDSGEDLMETMEQDERMINPALDRYASDDLDERKHAPMSAAQRKDAERAMRMRDKEERRLAEKSRMPAALLESSSDDEQVGFLQKRRLARLESKKAARQGEGLEEEGEEGELADDLGDDDEDDDFLDMINTEEHRGPLREWLVMDSTRRGVARKFADFLRTFTQGDAPEDSEATSQHRTVQRAIYSTRIRRMCAANEQSLQVNYMHLSAAAPSLAIWLVEAPSQMLEIFDAAARELVVELFPHYLTIRDHIFVRISHLPISDTLRDIRQVHLNTLIKVSGVVTRRTGIFPQLKSISYDCMTCAFVIGPLSVIGDEASQSSHPLAEKQAVVRPVSCPTCNGSGPFRVNAAQTLYRNFQRIVLQETPGTVPAGRLPRTKEVILLGDLIDSANPGEEIEITGIYFNNYDAGLNSKYGFPIFATYILANNIRKQEDVSEGFRLTPEDERLIRRLGQNPRIGEKIIRSVAPSIFGHESVKLALALSLFGGVPKQQQNSNHRTRGDINVLLLGDPGVAKSQFLKYIEKTSHRAVYTTGMGASAVGLTAAVQKDPITREWTLEGGALVLADQGVCCIDEFDKMKDQDRTSIHEAMEQQSISVSKAGIVTSLQARCAIIAAANPIGGKYDPTKAFSENVNLTPPILSRFDILCVIRDTVDAMSDEMLAKSVVHTHQKSHPNWVNTAQKLGEPAPTPAAGSTDDVLSQEILRKYLIFARRHIHPKLPEDLDRDKIASLYAKMRPSSSSDYLDSQGLAIGVRHVEAIVRIAEAHARMHLRSVVTDEDVNLSIRVMLQSIGGSQKISVARRFKSRFSQFLSSKTENTDLLFYELQKMVSDQVNYIRLRYGETTPSSVEFLAEEFESRVRSQLEITDCATFYHSDKFKKNNFSYIASTRVIIKRFG